MRKLFHRFSCQSERRSFGGSSFLELQCCKMDADADLKAIVAVCSVRHWLNDSLYVYFDDAEDFLAEYGDIFTDGLYGGMFRGEVDVCGINYYSPSQVSAIIRAVTQKKPREYETVLEWLEQSLPYNGVYILGV